jgi:hypothetical protein
VIWGLAGLAVGLLVILGLFFFDTGADSPTADPAVNVAAILLTATPTPPGRTPTASATPANTAVASARTPAAVSFQKPTPTATPLPGDTILSLPPLQAEVGWVVSNEARGNHFGDSYLYSGFFDGQIYTGAFRFDLSTVPRGASIRTAVVRLTGLREDRLARQLDRTAGGAWLLRMLTADLDLDQGWRRRNFQEIFNAQIQETLPPVLTDQDLALGRVNQFELSPAQIKLIEQLVIDNPQPAISFRLDGPLVGPDNLFAWDTGYGPESKGNGVALILNVGQPPATPPLYDYVVVTSTPTPENVVTAAAIAMQQTADARLFGTATPLPPNLATPTSVPGFLVYVPTSTPQNTATAQTQAAIATAEALTTGTPTPLPTNAVTATSTPSATPTLQPTPMVYVLITSTPTPETVFVAATLSAAATFQAQKYGTPTPLPADWATPFVTTPTPTPLNAATAQMIVLEATAQAFTTGTPTATPNNMVTATPTPVFVSMPLILTPTPVPVVTRPAAIPANLLGKILFRSDREAAAGSVQPADGPGAQTPVYVYDPATGELGRLTGDWPYLVALAREGYSTDLVYRTYIKQLLWTNRVEGDKDAGTERLVATTEFAVHFYDYKYNVERIVTKMGAGIVYDPVWSPAGNEIAFVATESGNDEIWVINHDGTNPRQLTRNTWEWDKFPTWSPDGRQIVFASNRTGNQQLWIMNADGSDQRLLLGWDSWTPYNDWAPVWVKHLEPAPGN